MNLPADFEELDAEDYEILIGDRLAELRTAADVSAREMSLAIGQSPAFISHIENHQAMPSMLSFLYICDYLHITPRDFFDLPNPNPSQEDRMHELFINLNSRRRDALVDFISRWI